MDAEIRQIVKKWTCFCIDRGIPCRSGNDPEVTAALERLGVDPETAFAYLFQHLIGPFSSESEHVLPQLLDVVSDGRNIVSFSEEFWENTNSAPRSILSISEIDTRMGLFYDVESDAVFEVDFEHDFPESGFRPSRNDLSNSAIGPISVSQNYRSMMKLRANDIDRQSWV